MVGFLLKDAKEGADLRSCGKSLNIILAITCSENVYEQFCSCITVDRDNNTIPAIIMGLEYNHCNEK